MSKYKDIIDLIPHQEPFRFIDAFDYIDETRSEGTYTFKKDEYFYKGHFPGYEVTPGVILTECMAQIGVLGMGIYTLLDQDRESAYGNKIFITSSAIDFLKPVFPGEKIKVIGEKEYFRFSKIKVKVKAYNEKEEIVAKGDISGVFMPKEKGSKFE